MKIKPGAWLLLSFLLLSGISSVYGAEWTGYVFTIEFKGLPKGSSKVGEPFVLTFSGRDDLVGKAVDRCGEYHGIYFVQPVQNLVSYTAIAQCFVRGKEA